MIIIFIFLFSVTMIFRPEKQVKKEKKYIFPWKNETCIACNPYKG